MIAVTIERPVHFQRRAYGQSVLQSGPQPPQPATGRIPRVAKLLALAHRFEEYLKSEQVRDQVQLADLGHVSRARISQIMNLLNLAPDIQEAILGLPSTTDGRDPIILADLQPIASCQLWSEQRQRWKELLNHRITGT